MRVVHINYIDGDGGAAIAADRLHQALCREGVDSHLLVEKRRRYESRVHGPLKTKEATLSWIRQTLGLVPVNLYKGRSTTPFHLSFLKSRRLIRTLKELKPDIVQLHWVCNSILTVEDIRAIEVPIVWNMHDMWTYTGGCNYDEDCGRFETGCGKCPVLGSDKENDLSRSQLRKKIKALSHHPRLVLNGLSRWIGERAKSSPVTAGLPVVNLPNPIDAQRYQPLDKAHARQAWGLPQDRKLLLFGAMGAGSNLRKGYSQLCDALKLVHCEDLELVVFGGTRPDKEPDLPFKTHYAGTLSDDVSLATLYSACDAMVVPSLQENLSNAIMESLACGVPVAAFAIGGNGDMIRHGWNGYLAKAFDPADLARGIMTILDPQEHAQMSRNARAQAVEQYDMPVVAKRYIELYRGLLDGVK